MKKNYIILLVVVTLSAFHPGYSQWTSIATFNQSIADLKVFNNKLFVGGSFYLANNNPCYISAYWNGSSLTNQTISISGGGINRFDVFNGELYATGGMTFGSNIGVAKWDGTTWVNASLLTVPQAGILTDVNDLYVGGNASGIVSKKTGSGAFAPVSTSFIPPGAVNAFAKFNGEIIAAGTFSTFNSVQLHNIARWDGTTWQNLGTGLNGFVRCLAVYNGDLYAGGGFTTAGGSNAKFIAKWNGTTWSDVAGSVTSTGTNGIRDMLVYDGKLYVCGDFTGIGAISASYIAGWDGTTWTDLQFNQGSNYVSTIEVYNNQLYAGTFSSPALYQMSGVLSVNNISNPVNISSYPNPCINELNISAIGILNSGNKPQLEIADMTGRIIYSKQISQNETKINTELFSSGVYNITLRSSEKGILLYRRQIAKF